MEEEKISTAERLYNDIKVVLEQYPGSNAKAQFIQEYIIPEQNRLMGRGEDYLSAMEIFNRVFLGSEGKQGESDELSREITRSEYRLTTPVALEVADIFYYLLQPNNILPINRFPLLLTVLRKYFPNLDQILNTGYALCIVKYLTRIEIDTQGLELSEEERVALEQQIMGKHLKDIGIPLRP